MEDQGIMALPQAGMQAPTAQPQAAIDPRNFSPEVTDYARMQPEQFGQDILGGIEAADPAMAAEFKQALAGMQLPPEIIDALGDMVDVILKDPENYDEIRTEFISEGVPEELLPPTFDPAYFAALNIALDQLSAQQGPVGMARGGIMALSPVATELAKMGRGGDRMIAHVTPAEARMLRRRGGSGTINPYTGQPEFFKKFFKSAVKTITQPFKSAAKIVKGVAKGLGKVVKKIAASPIGRIALTAAAVYFMGGAGLNFASGTLGISNAALAMGVNTFAASTAVNLASGQKFGDAVKNGAIAGVMVGVGTGVVQGFDATVPGAPVTPGTGVEVNALGETGGTTVNSIAPVSEAAISAPTLADQTANLSLDQQALYNQINTFEPNFRMQAGGVDLAQNAANTASDVTSGIGTVPSGLSEGAIPSGTFPGTIQLPVTTPPGLSEGAIPSGIFPEATQLPATPNNPWQNSFAQPEPSVLNQLSQGDLSGAAETAYNKTTNFFSPSAREAAANQAADRAADSAYARAMAASGNDVTYARQMAAAAREAAAPGFLSTYGPAIGLGVGAAYLGGAFSPKQPEDDGPPGTIPKETGFDLMSQDPGEYGTRPGGANVTYADTSSGYGYDPMQAFYLQQIKFGNPYANRAPPTRRMFAQGGIAAVAPAKFNLGGYASGGIGSMAKMYPRRTGQISGPGTGTSDDIPAMLSDGEFVMTAKAVRGAGKGSRREGAKRMYAMMRKLEGKA